MDQICCSSTSHCCSVCHVPQTIPERDHRCHEGCTWSAAIFRYVYSNERQSEFTVSKIRVSELTVLIYCCVMTHIYHRGSSNSAIDVENHAQCATEKAGIRIICFDNNCTQNTKTTKLLSLK